VIDRAMLACNNSGFIVSAHFFETEKLVAMPSKPSKNTEKIGFPDVGKTKMKAIIDYRLSRYACYLIVQNGDPRKEVIALGQTYFAIQTHRQEIRDKFDQLDEDRKRLIVRGDIRQWNIMLTEAARDAGAITAKEFAYFQNRGYTGLYGGLTVEDIHDRKGLGIRDKILDFMGSAELIANLFRISQTEEKLKQDGVDNIEDANEIHNMVGREVREAIKRMKRTMPEDLPTPEKSISQIEKEQLDRLKRKADEGSLMLDE
jgi:DNA-damage-inducible protein D